MSKPHRERLSQVLGSPLAEIGFGEARQLVFVREAEESLHKLSFTDHADPSGTFMFTFHAGVRFEPVERILRPDREQDLLATVSQPISSLVNRREYIEWPMSIKEEFDVLAIQANVMDKIHRYALPYLETYSTLSKVREALESEVPRDWPGGVDPQGRVQMFAAFDVIDGCLDSALQRLERAIEDAPAWPPKHRLPLKRLRDRLLKMKAEET